jgi:hypothetical protein
MCHSISVELKPSALNSVDNSASSKLPRAYSRTTMACPEGMILQLIRTCPAPRLITGLATKEITGPVSYFISEDSVAIALFAIRIVGLKERQMWRLNRSVVEEVVILGAVALFFVLAVLIPA